MCSFVGTALLALHLNHAAYTLEMRPSKVNTHFHNMLTVGEEIKVPLDLDGSQSASEVGAVVREQFLQICDSKPNMGWSATDCADDLVHQLEGFVSRVCSYRVDSSSSLSSGSIAASPERISISLHPNITGPRLSAFERRHVLSYLSSRRRVHPGMKVIDVGASMGGWSAGYVDALMDSNDPAPAFATSQQERTEAQPSEPASTGEGDGGGGVQVKHVFKANVNLESDWEQVLEHVKQHGKFDFAICTHTLEDLAFPQVPLVMLGRIAHEGFVAVS